jgi:hypothetical protein
MPKSRNKPTHSQSIKNRNKQMSEQTQAPNAVTLPPVRSIPEWRPTDVINITGFEMEALQNGISAVAEAQQAMQSILSRNIVEGTIKMNFEKLDAKTLQYGPMSDEEKAPYLESFEKTIATIKEQQAKQQAEAEANAAKLATPEAKEEAKVEAVLDGATAPKKEAKVVNINKGK